MQEVYAALMLHESGQAVNEDNVKKILSSAGANVDDTKIKALVASLSGVNLVVIVTEPTVSGMHDLKRVSEVAEYFKIKTQVVINKYE
jgi:MinD superfamily P-loop ATPase